MKLVVGLAESNQRVGPQVAGWCWSMAAVALRSRVSWYLEVQIVCRLNNVSNGITMTSGEWRLTWQTLRILKPQHQREQREVI